MSGAETKAAAAAAAAAASTAAEETQVDEVMRERRRTLEALISPEDLDTMTVWRRADAPSRTLPSGEVVAGSEKGVVRARSSHVAVKGAAAGFGGLILLHTGLIIPASMIAGGAWLYRRHRRRVDDKTGMASWRADQPEPESFDWTASLEPGAATAWSDKAATPNFVVRLTKYDGSETRFHLAGPGGLGEVVVCLAPTRLTLWHKGSTVHTAKLPYPLVGETELQSAWLNIGVVGARHVYVGLGFLSGQQILLSQDLKSDVVVRQIGVSSPGKLRADVVFSSLSDADMAVLLDEEKHAMAGAELLHQMKESGGPLQRLKADSFVHHEVYEERFEKQLYMVMVTDNHVCLLRRPELRNPNVRKHFLSIGLRDVLSAKLGGVGGFRLTGLTALANVAAVQRFEVDESWALLSIQAVDQETLDIPIPQTHQGKSLLDALLAALGHIHGIAPDADP